MGRTRKDDIELPPLTVESPETFTISKTEEVKVVQDTSLPNFTHTALSVMKDGGSWYLVQIPFDPKTLALGSPIKSAEGEIKAMAMERFKIEAGKLMHKDS